MKSETIPFLLGEEVSPGVIVAPALRCPLRGAQLHGLPLARFPGRGEVLPPRPRPDLLLGPSRPHQPAQVLAHTIVQRGFLHAASGALEHLIQAAVVPTPVVAAQVHAAQVHAEVEAIIVTPRSPRVASGGGGCFVDPKAAATGLQRPRLRLGRRDRRQLLLSPLGIRPEDLEALLEALEAADADSWVGVCNQRGESGNQLSRYVLLAVVLARFLDGQDSRVSNGGCWIVQHPGEGVEQDPLA
mmetsp:Transcript_6486/g.23242  ORF Transcript_6486/g.23242 Transcript_6486/m.23242 type:complete len:243 (-) Transcript_6486:1436-2164(-)